MPPFGPARIRVKLLAFGALAVAALLAHLPLVVVAASAATCAAIPFAAGLLGGADLVRAVFLLPIPDRTTNPRERSLCNDPDDPTDASAAAAR